MRNSNAKYLRRGCIEGLSLRSVLHRLDVPAMARPQFCEQLQRHFRLGFRLQKPSCQRGACGDSEQQRSVGNYIQLGDAGNLRGRKNVCISNHGVRHLPGDIIDDELHGFSW